MVWSRRRRFFRRRGFRPRPRRSRFPARRRFGRRRIHRRPRRRLTTRRVRDIAARKCRDNMRPATINADGTFNAYGGLNMSGNNLYGVLFSPTARIPTANLHPTAAERIKARCFVKGFSERVNFRTSNGETWRWRRIVFQTLGLGSQIDNFITNFYDGVNGHARSIYNIRGGSTASELGRLYSIIFEGTRQQDWANPLTAKVDTSKVQIFSDQMYVIQSKNSRGTDRNFKFWYPINRTIQYDDSEEGAESKSFFRWADWSSAGRGTMGDLFVFDIMSSNENASGDSAIWSPHMTYYWHEGQMQ